jgi:hypothetical protein
MAKICVVNLDTPPLTEDKMKSPDSQKFRHKFDKEIEKQLGKGMKPDDYATGPDIEASVLDAYSDDTDGDEPRMPDRDDYDEETYDQYIGAERSTPSRQRKWRHSLGRRHPEGIECCDGSLQGARR